MDLSRFTAAHQKKYDDALQEIKKGRKVTHWMWYIFPQIKGLGESPVSKYYAIDSLEEAECFLADEYPGGHLREISRAVLDIEGKSARSIFGSIDALKLCSSMTLFEIASNGRDDVFTKVLEKYYNDKRCQATLERIKRK